MNTILQLTVSNHPGVLAHIAGLFARRAFNVDSVLCLPLGDGSRSCIWLRVQENERLDQLIKQLGKLVDVYDIEHHEEGHPVFEQVESLST